MSTCRERISLAHALGARKIIRSYLTPTPLRQHASLNRHIGANVYVKHEYHNPTGTFKIRGGITVLKQIRPEIAIIATQAEASQAACMSWKAGEIVTAPRLRKTAGTIAINPAEDECRVERVFSLRF